MEQAIDRREAAAGLRLAPLGLRFKAEYGAGSMIHGIVTSGLNFFLLFYLTAVCGLSGTLAGTASLVALTIDAVADPLIGLVSDRTQSRLGRRVPYMLAGLPPVALAFGAIFSIPAGLSGHSLFAYVCLCLIVLRLGQSLFFLPFTAVGAEVTDDYQDRASVVGYRLTFDMLGGLAVVLLGLGLFMAGEGGLIARHAYAPFAWTCAAIMLVAGGVATRATHRARTRLHVPEPEPGSLFDGIFREALELLRNRSFLILSVTVFAFLLAYAASAALTLHAAKFFWGLGPGEIQIVVLGLTLGPILGFPVSALLLRRLEKRSLAIASFAAFSVLQFWPPLLKLAGLAPASDTIVTAILFVNSFMISAAVMGAGIGFQSMLADTADEHEWLFGVRREGLFFSSLTLAGKAALGLGGFLSGVALDLIHFPTEATRSGQPLILAPEVMRNLGLVAGPLPAAISLIAPLVLIGYALSKAKHAGILKQLALRKSAQAA